jgi:hypothetical protein
MLAMIAQRLRSVFPNTSIRGEDAASFVFVQTANRSVEISMLGEQRIWVEFWEHALGEDSPLARQQTYDAANRVLDDVIPWLNNDV